jgi:osmotically-inducible protein OsmY
MPIQNEHLELQVNQTLQSAAELSSRPIQVVCDDGHVELRGSVPNFRCKLQAHEIVSACQNVRAVTNNLIVDPPQKISDQQLVHRVKRALSEQAHCPVHSIRVDVHDGAVTISGYVSSDAERVLVADLVSGVDSVRNLQDMLMVNPDRALANHELATTIRVAISRVIGMENEDLIVAVVDESTQLSGCVDAIWKKEAAEQAVRRFEMMNVVNGIEIKLGNPG